MREVREKMYYIVHINYSVNRAYIFSYRKTRIFTTNQAWKFVEDINNSSKIDGRILINNRSIREIKDYLEKNYLADCNFDNTKTIFLITNTVSDERGNDIIDYTAAEKKYEEELELLLDENDAYNYQGNINVVDVNSFSELEQEERDNAIYEEIREKGDNKMKKKYEIVVLDLETTGFNKELDEILQVSIIDKDKNVLLNEYCKPEYMKSWKSAEAVNGISPDIVKDKKPFKFFAKKVEEILNNAEKILIYNAQFDAEFLHAKGLKFPDDIIIDVMLDFSEIYGEWNEYFGNYKWQKLSTAAAYYGYKFNAHDSLEDVKATLFVYNQMKIWGTLPN